MPHQLSHRQLPLVTVRQEKTDTTSVCPPVLAGIGRFVGIGLVAALLLTGCAVEDPIARHKILTSFFDGVPALPSVQELCLNQMEQLCEEYNVDITEELTDDGKMVKRIGSQHRPYAEKNCEGCHDFQATNLLIRPRNQLCFVCHKNFITGSYVHGPVSVGDCLACHLPHESKHTSLLQESKSDICAKCHREDRLAAKMHRQVVSHQMECVDCHDPHSGGAQYFLK